MFLLTILLIGAMSSANTLEIGTQTGPTPPPIPCPDSLCSSREDGNYEIPDNPNYFVQCSNGLPYCQACWPLSLVFKQECNQCMYRASDACYTTRSWETPVQYPCPDLCPSKGPDFRGNIADPNEPRHYIGCWDGVTVGCVNCPIPLLFNEPWNACLWGGIHHTQPLSK